MHRSITRCNACRARVPSIPSPPDPRAILFGPCREAKATGFAERFAPQALFRRNAQEALLTNEPAHRAGVA